MKVMIKATGEIVEVEYKFPTQSGSGVFGFNELVWVEKSSSSTARQWKQEEIEMIKEEEAQVPEYTKLTYLDDLRNKAAIAAMQGILANSALIDAGINYKIDVVEAALSCADELIERIKIQK